jgi:hypothetical protein
MRVRLFNKEFPDGKLFTDEAEYTRALREEEWFENFWMPSGKVPEDLKECWGEKPIEPMRLPEEKHIIKEELIAKDVPKKEEAVKYCECGGGQVVKNRFALGPSWRAKRGIKNGDVKNDKPPD